MVSVWSKISCWYFPLKAILTAKVQWWYILISVEKNINAEQADSSAPGAPGGPGSAASDTNAASAPPRHNNVPPQAQGNIEEWAKIVILNFNLE